MSKLLKKSLSSTVKSIAITLAVTALLIVILEIALRLFWGAPLPGPDLEKLAYDFHPDYLIKMKPNMVKKYTRLKINGGDKIVWRTNSAGFRGKELRDDADFRVVVYGDSNVQARFTRLEDTFTEKLAYELAAGLKKDVEVVNAGILGFGPDQSYLKFKDEAEMLKPDLVIFNFFADNDYGDVIRNRLFDLNRSGGIVKTKFPRVADEDISSKGFLRTLRILMLAKEIKSKFNKEAEIDGNPNLIPIVEDEFKVYSDSRPSAYSHFFDHYDV
ncbi:MAG: hypothetical protein V3V95_01795, partial [Thermodesulfobacteriota bacterium]